MKTKNLNHETNYLIVDDSANTGKNYINEYHQNTANEEQAMVFGSEQEARKHIEVYGWQDWAGVSETNYPVNY